MANPVIEWAKDNPLLAGGAAIAVIAVVMLATGGGSSDEGGSGGMGSAGVQAYYAAVANQAQAGAVIQTTQIRANAETNRALIGATYGLEAAKVSAATEQGRTAASVQIAQIQGNTATQVARIGGRVEMARVDAIAESNRAAANLAILNAQRQERELSLRGSIANLAANSRLGKAQRGAVYQAAITGTAVPVNYKPVNPGNSAAAIIGAGADFIGQAGKLIAGFA